jgi:uncharacterized heparinase superfamily protein
VSRPATWYLSRARAMSGRELAWRASQGVRRRVVRRQPDLREIDWRGGRWPTFLRGLAVDVDHDAKRIAAGELCYWGRSTTIDPIAPPWEHGTLAWARDPKCRWELRRHQHLFPLAAGGHGRLCIAQMLDWLARRPPADEGAAAAYEAAHRVVTWSWALPFAAAEATPAELARISAALVSDASLSRERPSLYSSANNHRLAELAGLLALEALTDGAHWNDVWRAFEREVVRQTFPDGGTREQAAGYLLYVLEIVWVAGLYALAVGQDLGRVGDRTEASLQWLDAVAGSDGEPPPFGDDAEDRFIRVDYFQPRRASLTGARLRTLLDGDPHLQPSYAASAREASCVLADSGYVVMRDGPVRLVVDVGPLGFGSLAAHGHADALSITLDAGDETLLRDSGTGTYVAADGRDAFRVSAAHNTVTVDGRSQAQPLGPHLWGRRFTTTVHAVELGDAVDYVRASHDGYRPNATHTRAVTFLKPDLIVVLDRVTADAARTVELHWQTMPGRAFGGVVVARPHATRRDGEAPFSPRYTWIESAPRTTFSARGRDVVFATVLSLTGTPAVDLSHDGTTTTVDIGERRLAERW